MKSKLTLAWFLCFWGTVAFHTSQAEDWSTSVEKRRSSWKQHERMRKDSPFASLHWTSIGPEYQGGRIESIATEFENASTMYVGVGSGGVWKTEDAGASWKPIFKQQAAVAIGDVAVSKSDPKTVWVGTGEVLLARSSLPGMGVFRSQDGGQTWSNMGLEDTQHIARVIVDPTDSNRVLVAAIGHQNSPNMQRGVFRTTDGGQSWSRILHINDHTAAIDLAIDPQDSDTLYACMWERDLDGQEHSGSASSIHKSSDGGDTWRRLGGGLPTGENVGRIAIAVAPSQPEVLYALADEGSRDGLYRSADAGESWELRNTKLQARWDWCEIHVSPDNPDTVYSIGQNSFISEDGGEHFLPIVGKVTHLREHGSDVLHLDTHAMWINPENPEHLVFGTDGGIYVTHDRCQNWLHQNNLPIAECYAITYDNLEPYNIFIGTQDNAALFGPHTYRPKQGQPEAWQHVYLDPWGGGDSYFTYRDPNDKDTVYYEHQYGALRRKNLRTNRTESIQPKQLGHELRFAWMTPYFLSKFDSNTLYCGANRVFRSTDRGDTWQPISQDLVGQNMVPNIRYRATTALAESAFQPGVLYAGTDNAELYLTTDDGKSWTAIHATLPKRAITRICPSPHNERVVYVTLSGAGIDDFTPYVYRSDDLGQNWHSIQGGLPMEPVNVVMEDPRVQGLLYLGTDMGVYASSDGGENWLSLCSNLPTCSVHDLFVHPETHELTIGTHGLSVFLLDAEPIQAMALDTQPHAGQVSTDDSRS